MKIFLKVIFTFFTLLILSQKGFSQGGDVAASAAASPVTLPFAAAGTTCGHVDNYDPLSLSTGDFSGRDWLYYFCATTTGTVDIMLNNPNTTDVLIPAILAYSTTPNAAGTNYMASSYDNALPNLVNYVNGLLSIHVVAGQCYYVMIDEDYDASDFDCFAYNINIQYHVPPPIAPLEPACSNIGYDNGTLGSWIGTSGQVTLGAAGAPTPSYTPMYYNTTTSSQHLVTTGGTDPFAGFPMVNPGGGPNSLRLGDGATGGAAGATLEQKFQVTASNALFVYYYAVVVQDGGADHTNQEQPFFKTDIYDCAGNAVPCGQYLVTGGPGIPGFISLGGSLYYKNWSPVAVDLTPFIGTCVTVRYTVGDCIKGAHFCYAYIDATCSPLAISGVNQICPTKSTVLTAPVGLFTYSWTPGGQTTQSITVSPTVTTTYTCELTSYTNCKTFLTYSVSLFPQPIASASSETICNGTSATITTTVNNGAGTYAWAPSGGTGSSANVSPGTTTNYTMTYTDGNGCKDTAVGKVTVNPIPTLTVPASPTVCHGGSIAASAFSSTVAGTTFSWTNTNTSIGLGASGTGNTPAFTASNVTSGPVTAVVSVTPSANNCVGPAVTYSIIVNPIPNVNAVTSATYCNGSTVPAANFTGSVTSTTYSWTNTNSTIGLGVSGTGNIAAFGAINGGASTTNGVVTVTPSANSCVGSPTDFTITINPTPNVNAVTSGTYCNGSAVPAANFTGSVTSTTYTWSNSNSTIGLGASGTGNIASYNGINNGSAPAAGVITVTPSANNCLGTPTNFTITVNPTPNVNAVASGTYCNGTTVPAANFTGSVTSTTYSWTNTNSAIGLGTAGTGNIASYGATNSSATSISGVITVTPSANTCLGNPTDFTITVNPTPNVNAVSSGTYCNGASVPAANFTGSVTSTTYTWSNSNSTIGLGASGTGNIASYNGINNGSAPIAGVITVTPSANACLGTPTNFTITVNPTPNINAVTSGTYCNGTTVPAANFTGSVTSTTYSWTNTNSAIGLGTAGTGNIASYGATNSSAAPIFGVITVTPSANTCLGNPTNYTITVNPTPNVNAVTSGTYCSGASVPAANFTGSVTSTTYSWSNTNSTIGLGASGTGNIASYSATNNGSTPVTGVITVTPSANACLGAPTDFTITVNPIPTVNAVTSGTYCNGASVPAVNFSGNVATATYSWVNTNLTIGLAGAGIGNIASYSAINNGATQVSGVITVTPSANACVGNPTNFTITVNPIPTVTVPASSSVCSGATIPASTFSGNIASATYSWTNTDPSIGLGASGVGNIPSFTSTNTGAVSATGIVSVTPSANGCIGTPQSFSITVNPIPVAPTAQSQTLCPGSTATLSATAPGGTYSWYDAASAGNLLLTGATYVTPNLSNTTTYYVNTTNMYGCTSSLTPVDAQVLNFLPVNASPNQTICAGLSATLSTTPSGAGYSYTWDAPGTPAFSTIVNPVVTPAATTMYTVTVLSSNGCSGTGLTKVTVNPLPVANPGNPIAFCDGQSGMIGSAAVSGYSYLWTPATGLSSSTISNPTVTLANSGSAPSINNYSLTVTLNGCQSGNTVQVTVNNLPVSNAGSPLTLCAGQTGTIGATTTNGYSYSWTPLNNLDNGFISSPTVSGVNAGSAPISTTYTVTTTEIATTCQSKASVVVSILPLPTVNAGSVPAVCAGTSGLLLNGSVGGSVSGGLWSGGAGVFSPNNTTLNGNYTPTAAEYASGSITLTLTAQATAPCLNVASTVVLNFYPNPVITFSVDNPKGCPEHCVVFTDQSTIGSPDNIQSWVWNYGDGQFGATQNPMHCYSTPGFYDVTLTATSNHSCTASLTMPQMIEVYPVPIASFYPDPAVAGIFDPNFTFNNTSQDAVTYLWDFGDVAAVGAANTSTLTSPSHGYTYAGTYDVHLMAVSIHGCVAKVSQNIEVTPEFVFYIPNAFTPANADGINDIFTGAGVGIEKYEMWIFDRWGANIYYSDDIQKGWNGKVQGKQDEVQQDVYIWKVKLKDVLGKNHEYIGHVTVLK